MFWVSFIDYIQHVIYHFDTGIIGIITFVIFACKKWKITWNKINSPGQDTNNLSLTISNKMSQDIEFAKIKEYN